MKAILMKLLQSLTKAMDFVVCTGQSRQPTRTTFPYFHPLHPSFLLSQVSLQKEASLVVIVAGGVGRGRASTRRTSFGGGVFDLVFGWHCSAPSPTCACTRELLDSGRLVQRTRGM